MIKIERFFPHAVTLTLVVLGIVARSAAIEAAAVVSLGLVLANGILEARYNSLTIKTQVPEELKRALQDLGARVTTIEYGIKTRGF